MQPLSQKTGRSKWKVWKTRRSAIQPISPSQQTQGTIQASANDNLFRPALKFWPVIAAVLLACVYYGLIASDRYVTSATFIIRGADTAGFDMVGLLTGLPGAAQSQGDTHILKEYMVSADMVAKLRKEIPLDDIFRRQGVDSLSRLKKDATLEELQHYWKDMVHINIDKTSGMVTLNVRAFTPEDSMTVISAILKAGEERLNTMSKRSRADILKLAADELQASIADMNRIRAKLSAFRVKHKMLDPKQTAETQQEITGKLEQELVEKTADRANLLTYMQPTAPQVEMLTKRINSLKELLDQQTTRNIGALTAQSGDAGKPSTVMDEYSQLSVDLEVAEKTYIAATEFMETSRIDSMRQSRYLTVFSEPHTPEQSNEPRRLEGIFIVFVLSLLLWGAGQLIMATIKEHRQWNL